MARGCAKLTVVLFVVLATSVNLLLLRRCVLPHQPPTPSDELPPKILKISGGDKEKSREKIDTAIIITSSWIPSHPSTNMIDTVIKSTEHLIGLPKSTPILITIDTFPLRTIAIEASNATELTRKMDALEEYSTKLTMRYLATPHVHVLPGMKHWHIGGSVMKALNLIEKHYPMVEFVYYMQHDFCFVKEIDHLALVDVMNAHPTEVNHIMFPDGQRNNRGRCGRSKTITHAHTPSFIKMHSDNRNNRNHASGAQPEQPASPTSPTLPTLNLYPTKAYSDNNHFARFHWYKETIASMEMLVRPPEFPLQKKAFDLCVRNESMGLYFYGSMVLQHLDGRGKLEF